MAMGIALTAGIVAVNVSLNRNEVTFSDITKANIEALADGEESGGGQKICYYKGTTYYADYYECTSDYPNVGTCSNIARKNKYFSSDRHVCNQL
jgi:hypothetical protein